MGTLAAVNMGLDLAAMLLKAAVIYREAQQRLAEVQASGADISDAELSAVVERRRAIGTQLDKLMGG